MVGLLSALHILWVLINSNCHVAFYSIIPGRTTALKIPCSSPIYPSPSLPTPVVILTFLLSLQFCMFQNVIQLKSQSDKFLFIKLYTLKFPLCLLWCKQLTSLQLRLTLYCTTIPAYVQLLIRGHLHLCAQFWLL